MDDCIFCKIVKGEIPSTKLIETEHAFAFLDINPASKGHSLVIPKKHFTDFEEIPSEELSELIKMVQKVAIAVKKSLNAEGFNIHVSNGKTAGQVVFHLHFHIIPRSTGDSIGLTWTHKEYSEGEVLKVAEKIKKLF